ncbi:MAG: shikimate kinase [Glaciecola sp.]|jgi:shikimate kinase
MLARENGAELNVVLTGFMGTGKSAVGRHLASRLNLRFVDTDALIAARHGSIPEIFAIAGEAGFRRLERSVAIEVARSEGQVIATGGRMLLDRRNANALAANGRVLCLAAPARVIVARVLAQGIAGRPLLDAVDPAARVRALLAERAAGYGRFEQIPSGSGSPAAVAARILARL